MITAKDVRNKRFEKAAFGYKQEEIDEFLSQLEAELDEMERDRIEANKNTQTQYFPVGEDAFEAMISELKRARNFIFLEYFIVDEGKMWGEVLKILADKVREYMKDEDALKDALLGAQKQGHQVIDEANEKAKQILAEAQAKADQLEDEAVRQHAEAMEKNRAEIAKEKSALIEAQQQVADFKKSLFDMYKSHLELISSMPETFEEATGIEIEQETAEEIAAAVAAEEAAAAASDIQE